MKSIRNIAFSVLLTLGAFSAVTYTSCNKDECKDVVCQNGGTCNSDNGSCACATGFEGNRCETQVRAKFVRSWTATDKNINGTVVPTYQSAIANGATVNDVLISDFSDGFFTNDVKATVSGNTITIPSQSPDNDNFKVEGTGTYNPTDKKITWSYTLTNPAGQTQSYTGTWQ